MWWEQRAGRQGLTLRTMMQRKLCAEAQQSPAATVAAGMEGLDKA